MHHGSWHAERSAPATPQRQGNEHECDLGFIFFFFLTLTSKTLPLSSVSIEFITRFASGPASNYSPSKYPFDLSSNSLRETISAKKATKSCQYERLAWTQQSASEQRSSGACWHSNSHIRDAPSAWFDDGENSNLRAQTRARERVARSPHGMAWHGSRYSVSGLARSSVMTKRSRHG